MIEVDEPSQIIVLLREPPVNLLEFHHINVEIPWTKSRRI